MSPELMGLLAPLSAGGGNERSERSQLPTMPLRVSLVGIVFCFGVRVSNAEVER